MMSVTEKLTAFIEPDFGSSSLFKHHCDVKAKLHSGRGKQRATCMMCATLQDGVTPLLSCCSHGSTKGGRMGFKSCNEMKKQEV